jgi:hypothetical protein
MQRSAQRRGGRLNSRNKRIAVAATIFVVFGCLVTVTQVSSAKTRSVSASADCGPSVPGAAAPNGQSVTTTQQNGRNVRNHWGDGQEAPAGCASNSGQGVSTQAAGDPTVNCPSVAGKLPNVPAAAKAEVDKELAQLDTQIADANKQLASKAQAAGNNANAANNANNANNGGANNGGANNGGANNNGGNNNGGNANAVLDQLKAKRAATIKKINDALTKAKAKPQGLDALAACTLAAAANNGGNANGGKNNGGNANAGNNGGKNNNNAGKLQILADTCGNGGSKLTLHDGFQKPNRCVKTEMGEVGAANNNPSLLITQAPQQVKAGQAFQIRVSTRNLIRDRFLGAAAGGYYLEMSKLNAQGLVRGHFHTACRMLDNTNAAPDPAPAPAFFVATEDNGGSNKPDEIVINVTGLPNKGTAQCASWAGDGSHRIPMMERANQTPAFDAVRITVN